MLTVENTKVEGWEPAIRGMRNPLNSWEKSDSLFYNGERDGHSEYRTILGEIASGWHNEKAEFILGPNDKDLMERLAKAGKDHAKYRRMITVTADIIAPLYFLKEWDTYKVGTVANSCSTMHKIAAKEFTLEDFSCEHLMSILFDDSIYTDEEYEELEWKGEIEPGTPIYPKEILELTITSLNLCRKRYLETKDKRYWWQLIQLLPSSYNQRRTVMLNYEVLANIYHARKDHKLDEWHTFCDWAKELPESWIFTGDDV